MTVVNTAQAQSELAYDLQSQKQQQLIVEEEINVELGLENNQCFPNYFDICGALFIMSLSMLIQYTECVEGARDIKIIWATEVIIKI